MYPKYEQLKKMAVEKKYHRIPVAIEMYADVTTPVEALKKLRNVSQRCYLFESASQDVADIRSLVVILKWRLFATTVKSSNYFIKTEKRPVKQNRMKITHAFFCAS